MPDSIYELYDLVRGSQNVKTFDLIDLVTKLLKLPNIYLNIRLYFVAYRIHSVIGVFHIIQEII